MIRQLAASALSLALAAGPLHAASTPSSGRLDPRIRNAVYNPDQVFVVETDLRHATTIHFGQGETFQAVIVGDTESFQVDPIPEIGNILTIKPHVAKARTNMTVVTNRRTYSFDLVENAIVGGEFFEVRFDYPQDRRASASQSFVSKGAPAVRNASYKRAGDGDFAPRSVYDDGRYTYFVFPGNARQPAIFKVDGQGRERTVNWTQQGDVVRVLGTSDYWTVRIGDEAICLYRDRSALTAGN